MKKLTSIFSFVIAISAVSYFSYEILFNNTVVADNPQNIKVTNLSQELEHPWGMTFLPNGDLLITERPGRLRLFKDGKLLQESIVGLPEIIPNGQGGLLDVVLHPDFTNNQLVYLSLAANKGKLYSTSVIRGKLNGMQLENVETIFSATPRTKPGYHFGSRLVFANDGSLYISHGDRGNREDAQDLKSHAGALIRIYDDGSIPEDNPFFNDSNVLPEIYNYGHRNMQGMAKHPETGEIWSIEHGPKGGDELNRETPATNYGWPVITYGKNYGIGTKIGEGTHKEGMQQPVHYWVPSIGPSGLLFYTGDMFKAWQGSLLTGSLIFKELVKLDLDASGKIINEERLLKGKLGRVRDIEQANDGSLYIITDESDGKLIRLNN